MLRFASVGLLICLGTAGCGPTTSDVEGTVRYQGRPLAMGSVALHPPGHRPVVVTIGADGRFQAKGLPPGPVRVTVSSPDPAWQAEANREMALMQGNEPPPPPAANYRDGWFAIPTRYRDPYQTDLTATLAVPTTTLDLDLK